MAAQNFVLKFFLKNKVTNLSLFILSDCDSINFIQILFIKIDIKLK